jgi:hypothetical protein
MARPSRTTPPSATAGTPSASSYFDDMDDTTCMAAYESAITSEAAAGSEPRQQQVCAPASAMVGRQQMSGGAAPTGARLCDGHHKESHSRHQSQEQGRNSCCAEQLRCTTPKQEKQLVPDAPAPQGASHSAAPLCNGHGLPCATYQVKKQGPNLGRWFYKCPETPQCETFIWASDLSGSSASGTPPCSQEMGVGQAAARPLVHPSFTPHTLDDWRCAPSRASPGGSGASAAPTKRQLFTDDDLNEDFLAAVAESEAAAKRSRAAGDGPAG